LNSTPPTVIGSAGASGVTVAPGQRGHSTSATKAAAAAIRTTSATIANTSPAELPRRGCFTAFGRCVA
jgi:hypothetical protein